jgi:putative ATPase
MLILASEDIGNANPTALVIANNCFQAINIIGYPECELILSQTAIYLAASSKSNASYLAIKEAKAIVAEKGNLSVPLHLRNAPTSLMEDLDYGKDYKYSHEFVGNFTDQEYLPEELHGETFYKPGENAREREMKERLKTLWGKRYDY